MRSFSMTRSEQVRRTLDRPTSVPIVSRTPRSREVAANAIERGAQRELVLQLALEAAPPREG